MSHKTRLDKLEAPLERRWRDAWGGYYELVYTQAGELIEPLSSAAEAALAANIFRDDAEAESFFTALGERLGMADTAAWAVWALMPAVDDTGPPDYSQWPRLLPEPPQETPGALERLEAYQPDGVAETFAALLLRFAVVHARMHREYMRRCG